MFCGQDVACLLVNGLAGDIDDARNSFPVQAEVGTVVGVSRMLRFSPLAVEVATTVNVRIVMGIRRERAAVRNAIEQLSVLRINGDTGATTGPSAVKRRDDGLGVTGDNTVGDGVFTNLIAVRDSFYREIFSCRAVPVQAGAKLGD